MNAGVRRDAAGSGMQGITASGFVIYRLPEMIHESASIAAFTDMDVTLDSRRQEKDRQQSAPMGGP